ncbi:hypothetical protein SNEBB_009169 [Seison nebaliae]|nr:hypothetical protein SNEBB_009169 [Seison nebaliae]
MIGEIFELGCYLLSCLTCGLLFCSCLNQPNRGERHHNESNGESNMIVVNPADGIRYTRDEDGNIYVIPADKIQQYNELVERQRERLLELERATTTANLNNSLNEYQTSNNSRTNNRRNQVAPSAPRTTAIDEDPPPYSEVDPRLY